MKPSVIVVVESGWVFAGTEDVRGILKDAAVIRRWGTTRGLGELAANGPTSETELDPIHLVEIPESKVLFRVPVICDKVWIK